MTSPEGFYTTDPWAHRRGEPRTFAAAWILFLFGATVVSVGSVGAFGLMSADVYRPAARLMVAIATVGIAILWPMVRLSQEAPGQPVRSAVLDVIIMAGPIQAIIWPQALPWMAGWPLEVVLCLHAFLTGWTIFLGGLLALYFRRPLGARWLMMLVIVAMILLGPLAAALSPPGPVAVADPSRAPTPVGWLMTSPLTGVYEITRDRSWTGRHAVVDARHWLGAAAPWAMALLAWGFSIFTRGPGEGPGVAVGRSVA